MSGKHLGVMIYLGVDHDPRWIYTWLLQLLYKLDQSGLKKAFMHFYISMLSPCTSTIESFCKGLDIKYTAVPKPLVMRRFGGVSSELKNHHLETMVDANLVILSQDYQYDVYLDSLIKSFRPIVLLVPTSGETYTNEQMQAIKDKLS